MRGDEGQAEVGALMRRMGYIVNFPPEGVAKSCDVEAVHENERLWIEVKDKELSDQDRRALADGQTIRIEAQVRRWSKLRDILQHAAGQIATTAGNNDGLRLVWIRLQRPGDITRRLQLFSTVYGISWFRITEGPPPKSLANVVPCFLADHPWFVERTDIAGVVVQSGGDISLWTNPFACDNAKLANTKVGRLLASMNAVFDIESCRDGLGLYITPNASRGQGEQAVIAGLRETYRIEVVPDQAGAYSMASTGRETGRYDAIDGADFSVPVWVLEEHLRRSAVAQKTVP